ncbi:MAG: DNA-directed RNA polymerase subunit beta' [Candidatus Shikimatogenerans bostrichidophilus]|nr:MAG: DNA-directed RNA polymerase subunit beta' [Candidatus Shikimatogenerans bostrichidophilus]
MLKNNIIDNVTITLASPDSILKESYGEVLNPETINYRTQKPEINGLFCEKIFGPINDFECSCGKYKNIKYKGIFCDRCGIEITNKIVRRKRIGHIKLAVPIVHIWAFKCLPNKISYLIGKSSKEIDDVIYYFKYIILNLGELNNIKIKNRIYKKYDIINEEKYKKIKKIIYKYKIVIKTGGEAIRYILKHIDYYKTYLKLKKQANKNNKKKSEILKRIKVVELFLKSEGKNRPEDLVIKILPVIPPDLRPLIVLENGKYASSDLNDFYRKIIIRNNRLKKLIKIQAPEVILKNEKRMLQESVDSLFDNSRKKNSIKSENNRELKSLSDILKGKLGRFRLNLLGKRVDFSARSVIVVDPNLKLHECGLPREIALELYKPHIINKLLTRGKVKTIKEAKLLIKKKKKKIWYLLKNIVKGYPILLNRAPTLHKFSIQAFYPKLIKTKSIKLHPLVCSAFNADFDGDQMAVHLPLSIESILEAKLLMLSPNNILNISNGSPIIAPTQDIILGLYYLTILNKKYKIKNKIYRNFKDIFYSYNFKYLKIHDRIKFYYNNKIIKTTVGRVFFNNIIPIKEIGFINKLINKDKIKNIILEVLNKTNIIITSKFLDNLKKIGLKYAFKGGLSFNLKEIIISNYKNKLINLSKKKINKIYKHYNMGFITNVDKNNKILEIWSKTSNKIGNYIIKKIKKQNFNSVYMMLDSGARSSKEQIRQLSGIRGLVVKGLKLNDNNDTIVEIPIISNFLEGFSVLEYFISTNGSRKGLADTCLKTADAGYLTRRLVDVVQDTIIKENDCKTLNGIKIKNKNFNKSNILGRIILFNIFKKKKIIIKKGTIIRDDLINVLKRKKIKKVIIRSPLTCEAKEGICSLCYGLNLSTNNIVNKGEAIGIIAAQSIGEPGTQLTLRTFHVGGYASNITKEKDFISKYKGIIKFKRLKYIKNKNKYIVISRISEFSIIKKKKVLFKDNLPYGCYLLFKNNEKINVGNIIYKIDPHYTLLISETSGTVKFNNLIKYKTYKINVDKKTGYKDIIIIDNRKIIPSLKIISKENKIKEYYLPVNSYLKVKNNEKIKKGTILIKTPRGYYNDKNITGGLPRLSELFEARKPSNPALISDINGFINFSNIRENSKGINIYVKSYKFKKKIKYKIKANKQILVQNNDYIKCGNKLTDGNISFNDLLNKKGIKYLQKYLIDKIQEVYKSQGVEINNKHFEIIIKQMMRKVKIINGGDTNLIKGTTIERKKLIKENNKIKKKVIIKTKNKKKLLLKKNIKKLNVYLKIQNKKLIKYKKTRPAIAKPILQGITKAALDNKSFISAASFQETTKILSEAAIMFKKDKLKGLKENVIIGNKIPAGTGYKDYDNYYLEVKSKKKYK